MPGESVQQEQGFRVTPGEALTDSHASGTKSMRAYGTVNVILTGEPMTILTLDDTTLSIALDDQQNSFYAALQENVLVLTPVAEEGEEWTVNAFALKVLKKSGVDAMRLTLGEKAVEIPTDWQMQGTVYARLSMAGYVSKDYTLHVTADSLLVSVGEQSYRISENNELVGG